MKQWDIDVHHLTRVEGHGNVKVRLADGRVEEVRLEIVESPRFFEMMLRGRHYTEAPTITSRICGICAVGHTTASLRACEAALGVTPSEQTVLLRRLILHAEIIQSHVLHYYLLVAPDFFGVSSVIPLAESHPDVVKRALRLKRLGNNVCETLVGRHVHPISMCVDGFMRTPTADQVRQVRDMLGAAEADVEATVDLFAGIAMPPFQRPTEYVALRAADGFALYDGEITSTAGGTTPIPRYRDKIVERVVPYSSGKHVTGNHGPMAVGALARLNVNFDRLHPRARAAADRLGFAPPGTNPFLNNVAQVIETVHCWAEALELCDALLERGIDPTPPRHEAAAGRGVGATEVPRGTLYHEYELDADGLIVDANCIIPTGQNLANIETDMAAYVPTLAGRSTDEITKHLEMLVRAYDPCISCSSHFLEVEFV